MVKQIFELSVQYGYGGRRIATELQKSGRLNHNGELFHYSSIQNILRNVMYTGVLRSGESQSDIIPELQIVDVDTFRRVREICEQRTNDFDGFRNTPRKVAGKALLSGNIF